MDVATMLNDASSRVTADTIICAVVLFLVTLALSRIGVHLIRRILSRDDVPMPSCSIFEMIWRIIVWDIGCSVILSTCFHVDVNALVTALGIGGVAISLGLQGTVSNFFGGLQITFLNLVQPGDHFIVGTIEGIVLDITWRQTVLRDFENAVHRIPNSMLNSNDVIKIEPAGAVSTMISFTNDTCELDETIAEMERLAKEAVREVAELERDPWILLTQIGEYGTWAKLRFVLRDTEHVREARNAALRAIAPYTRVNAEDLRAKRHAEFERVQAMSAPLSSTLAQSGESASLEGVCAHTDTDM